MLPSTGVRRNLISSGDWLDGLKREGSNPSGSTTNFIARVVELVYTQDLKSCAVRIEGSSPSSRTT
jgi:hypothetical protein